MIINKDIITVDNSALELFAICPRKFWYRCVNHLVPKKQKLSLSFGGSTHAGLFEYYSGSTTKEAFKAFILEARKEGSRLAKFAEDAIAIGTQAEYSLEFGTSLLGKYFEQHPLEHEDFRPLCDSDGKPFLEVGFCIELANGLYMGKIDGIGVWKEKDNAIIEHKTTKNTVDRYIKWLNPNNQITGYLKAVKDYLDFDVAKCIVNIIRVKDFKRGSPEDTDQRLFMRHVVERTPAQIDARMRQIDLQINLIKNFLHIGLDAFYMNAPFACNAFGDCEYKPLCAVSDDQDSEMMQMVVNGGYTKTEWHPYEIEPKRMIGNANGTENIQQISGNGTEGRVGGGESPSDEQGRLPESSSMAVDAERH